MRNISSGFVTLGRGAAQDKDLFDWFQQAANTASGLGLNDIDYKRNFDIVQQGRDGATLRRWSIINAWPVKFVAGTRSGSHEHGAQFGLPPDQGCQ